MRFIFAAIALAASACIQANGAALPLTSTDVPALAKRVVITNEHHLNWIGRPRAVKIADRAVDPAKKAEVDAAVAVTAHLPRYFWSGSFAPGGRENSVEMYAREMATARGGTTLEGTLANVVMPTWAEDDQDSVDLWDYASAHFAEQTTGETYVVLGETMRSAADGNVWLTIELPRIRNNPAVPRVLGFRIHRDNTEMPHIYYDAGTPNPPAPQAQTTYATSTACSAFASVGEWDRQLSPTQTHNIATTTEHGMWYGGMRTPGSNTTWTYSTVPAVDRTVRSQREMVAWITSHPTFEARWNSLLDNEPAEIDAHDGRGFIPFATACAWSAESTDQMNNLKLRALPVGDGLTSGLGSRRFVGYRNNIKQIVLVPPRYRTITVQPGNGGRPRRQEELPWQTILST
ncbi:hypothetical protein BKA62DRAFT_775696 [Auriculariales sp. MPI-PUGE-AT-0066]|nr:hypothetical protein BKA62DRAFT_775696 [Auriculariales sp. MPI-PUGE-AT-0066]